jgi:hypothetical protein
MNKIFKLTLVLIIVFVGYFAISGHYSLAEEESFGGSSSEQKTGDGSGDDGKGEPDGSDEKDPIDNSEEKEESVYVDILIRNGKNIIFNDKFSLPEKGSLNIKDQDGKDREISSNSVLGVLYLLDQSDDSFEISDLQYYDSFSSFYLKCLIADGGAKLCDNWQYVVGGTTPWSSIDSTVLSGGEKVGLYFGSPFKLEIEKNTIEQDEEISVSAFNYDYVEDAWNPRSGINIGLTTPDPENPWSPIVLANFEVDENGLTRISYSAPGAYGLGVVEDYFYPSYSVEVIAKMIEPEPEPVVDSAPAPVSGGGSVIQIKRFDVEKAIQFIYNNQGADGSFINGLYTDWVAISLNERIKNDHYSLIRKYLLDNPIDSSFVTEYQRRAMALMSIGINPYGGTSVNYIQKILGFFDGKQFGDANLLNDDIFSLIVLNNAGYGEGDEVVRNTVSFLISKQRSNGSIEDSIDMTSAYIQAVRNYSNLPGAQNSLNRAMGYILSNQKVNGSFGDNVFSTSWAMQVLDLSSAHFANAQKYMSDIQNQNGSVGGSGLDAGSLVWSTAYSVAGHSGAPWSKTMKMFNKESPVSFIAPAAALVTTAPVVDDKKIDSSTEEPIVLISAEVSPEIPEVLIVEIDQNLNTQIVQNNPNLDTVDNTAQEGNLIKDAQAVNPVLNLPVLNNRETAGDSYSSSSSQSRQNTGLNRDAVLKNTINYVWSSILRFTFFLKSIF